mmetsp:Transcript_27088/g.63275  ORF Transcript_27088/g.63275 Transcript_27088/m.63275 type:complete len:281 (+) Transcript_27088:621-1463(+)
MCIVLGCFAPWWLWPLVSLTWAPARRSSHIHGAQPPAGSRLPRASYGTSAACTTSRGTSHVDGRGGRSSSTSAASTASVLPLMLRVILPSCAVCCRLMMHAPSDWPARPRSAHTTGSWSAHSPPSDVPITRTRSAASVSCSIHSYSWSLREPEYLTTGLLGSNHEPWISQMRSCGKPAFCGRPSWFCCTQLWIQPLRPSIASAWCVGVGVAAVLQPVQPTLLVPLSAAWPTTEAEMPAPEYTTVRRERRISCASCATLARATSAWSSNSLAVSQAFALVS